MKVHALAIAAIAVSLVSRASVAESASSPSENRPSGGLGLLIGGGIVTGIGGVNILTAALCPLAPSGNRDLCYGLAFGVGGACILVGVPMLIVGANKRATYKEWLKDHPAVEGLSVVPVRGGGVIGWSADF